jgi:hypothetical protein
MADTQTPVARRALLRAAAVLPLASLGGCVVAPYGTYHRPSSTLAGAQLGKAWCQGQAGPETRLQADLQGVRLSVRTERQPRGSPPGVLLFAELTLPPGQLLHWQGAPRVLVEGRPLAVTPQVSARRSQDLGADQWVDVVALRPGTASVDAQAPYGTLHVRPVTVAGQPQRVVVEGLALEHAGSRWVLPATALARPASRTLPGTYRSEAEQASVLARADACRRDTPQLACDNIVEFSSDSHRGQDAVLRWHGRWYGVERSGRPRRFEGEMVLQPLRTGRLRVVDAGWQVRPEEGGPAQPLRAARAWLSFDDRLDAGQIVPAAGVETRIQVEALLPEDVPTFEFLLPPFATGGRRVQPPPIRFERRRFDGGLEPFNC